MKRKRFIKSYLNGLVKGDHTELLKLFKDNATVSSPVYGKMPATDFYRQLFEDTARSKILLRDIFANVSNPDNYAAHFIYDWTLNNGEHVSFSCVDMFQFEKGSNKIKHITIIYDASLTKDAFAKMHD